MPGPIPLNVGIIIQARMGSSRLPGKILKKVVGKTLLEHLIERLSPLQNKYKVIVATTTLERDSPIIELMSRRGVSCYRGSEEDVLSRTLFAARHFGVDVIVRITSDCPLMDPSIVGLAVESFLMRYPEIDYLSNTLERTFPRGEDVEIFKRRDLEKAHSEAFYSEEREHVTPFLWRHPELFAIKQFKNNSDLSFHRWTVDTEEDLQLVDAIFSALYSKNRHFTMKDIIDFLDTRPDLVTINQHIEQKTF